MQEGKDFIGGIPLQDLLAMMKDPEFLDSGFDVSSIFTNHDLLVEKSQS